jgi:hypothetical protein
MEELRAASGFREGPTQSAFEVEEEGEGAGASEGEQERVGEGEGEGEGEEEMDEDTALTIQALKEIDAKMNAG